MNHRHGGNQSSWPAGIANTPASHSVGFGHTVDGQAARFQSRLNRSRGGKIEPRVGDVLIHVIGHDPDMRMLQQQLQQGRIVLCRIRRARWVGGRVEQNPARARCERLLQLLWCHPKTGLSTAGHQHRLTSRQSNNIHIRRPIGGRHNDLIPRFQTGHEGIVEHLFGTSRDDDFIQPVVQIMVAGKLGADRLLQRRGSA